MNWTELENRAFVPYSASPRACIIQGVSGAYYPGVRVENISFPLTIPAIQAACCFCLSEGDLPKKLILKNDAALEQQGFWVQEFDLEISPVDLIGHIEFQNHCISIEEHEAKKHLKKLLSKAVASNSDFPVSAILFCENNNAVTAVNVEVSDWTKGICAERLALAKALALGYSGFIEMSLHTAKGEFSSPCGACRQVIHQHMPAHKLNLYHADDTLSVHFSNHLLPFSFTSTSLGK